MAYHPTASHVDQNQQLIQTSSKDGAIGQSIIICIQQMGLVFLLSVCLKEVKNWSVCIKTENLLTRNCLTWYILLYA